MHIYEAEKEAGIDFGNSTASVTATQVKIGNVEKCFDGMSVADLVKDTSTVQTVEELLGQEQPDLALVVAILVSTGWNLNDDIFTPDEVWKARSTSLHKPMNDNHDSEKILGHIVSSRVLDKLGKELDSSDDATPPDEFDIEVAGVLYKAFPALSERIDEIITKAKTGEMFVSMECWFPDFGYGFVDPETKETRIVERTEATAFLTKHLRIYGGCGEYQGYKVGRVLKDMIFGAQGFCDVPANPDSVIKVAASKVADSQVFVKAELNKLLEGGVRDVDEKQLKELEEIKASLESKTQEVAELQKAAKEFEAKDYDGQIVVLTEKVEKLTASVTEASEKVEVAEKAKAELQKQFDDVTQQAKKSEAELDGIRKTEMARDRLVKLSEVKKVEDEEATLAELREMTKETFEVVLKYAGEAKSEKTVEDKSEKTDVEAEQAQAALDNVKEEDGADFNTVNDAGKSEGDKWLSTAKALCGNVDEKIEGGE